MVVAAEGIRLAFIGSVVSETIASNEGIGYLMMSAGSQMRMPLVFAGLVTEQCVLMTALDAADRGFHCIIAADGCATIDRGSHEAALLMFRRVWGYVLPSREILAWVASKEQRRGALQ